MRTLINFLLCCAVGGSHAQSGLDSLLTQVARNNKTLQAGAQRVEADALRSRTGIQLSDPYMEYDYMVGSPVGAGNQTDFTIAQPFDFPTTYSKRKQLAEAQAARSTLDLVALRQDVLLDAQLTGLELIYANKRKAALDRRLRDAERMHTQFQKALAEGQSNVLEANKAQLHLLQTRTAAQTNASRITQLLHHLAELNGGLSVVLKDTIYPVARPVPDFTTIEREYEANDPLLKQLVQDETIAAKQVALGKSLWLPSMTAGYHYQGILGQTYSGVHLGVNIPLWEKRNTVKAAKAEQLVASLNTEDHRNEHYFEIAELHERYTQLDGAYSANRALFSGLNNAALLNKAYAFGELSSIQYFMEVSYYNSAEDDFLELERDRQIAVARLFKYVL